MERVHVRHEQNYMATSFDLKISCDSKLSGLAGDMLDEALLTIGELERELSEFHPESPIRELNEASPMAPVRMTASAIELLERSRQIRIETHGCFNPEAKGETDVRSLFSFEWDRKKHLAWKLHSGAHLSFAAIGRGYAIDRARALLERNGFKDFLLSAGGSSLAISGFAAPGQPWAWAWSWKKDGQGNDLGLRLRHLKGDSISIGVSGTQEKGDHILDSRDSRDGRDCSAQSTSPSCLSTLVGLPSAADADAFSTAFFIAGWDEILSIFKEKAAAPALSCIEKGGGMRWNGIFQNKWGSPERSSRPASARTLSF